MKGFCGARVCYHLCDDKFMACDQQEAQECYNITLDKRVSSRGDVQWKMTLD